MPRKPRKGPVPKLLSAEERSEFLRLRYSGLGQRSALRKQGIGWERFDNTRKKDRAFRDECGSIDEYLDEQLISLRLAAAFGNEKKKLDPDASAQVFLINLSRRKKEFAANLRLRRLEIAARSRAEAAPPPTLAPEVAAAIHAAAMAKLAPRTDRPDE